MENCREEWYDPERKVSVTVADVTAAANALVQGHLSGPVAARFLAEGLAAAALLGKLSARNLVPILFEPELGRLEDIFMHVTKGNLA